MAGRPPLPVGAHGNITAKAVGKRTWRARCYVRDADGHRREVVRTGTSKDAAKWAVQEALKDRPAFAQSEITRESTLTEVAEAYFEQVRREVAEGEKAPGTHQSYLSIWVRHIQPAVGGLRCRECTVVRMEAFFADLGDRGVLGSPRRKNVKTVMSGIASYATRMGAMPTNPVRDTSRIVGASKREPRALTPEEIVQWLDHIEAKELIELQSYRPRFHDIYDLTLMMLATGSRISEILAVLIEDVDIEAGTVVMSHRVRRITGSGMQRVKRRGHKGGTATLKLSRWAVELVQRRAGVLGPSGPLFPTRTGAWRDPSDTAVHIRLAREGAGLDWMTSHTWRKTVATLLDDAGVATRLISDRLQHSKVSMTQDNYHGRGAIGIEVAEALEMLDPKLRKSGG